MFIDWIKIMDFLAKCEFSLTDREKENQIVARLRIPSGILRDDIRAWIRSSDIQVVKQYCVGNETHTIAWSKLIFFAPLDIYHELQRQCKESNLYAIRQFTTEQILQLERIQAQRQRCYSQEDLHKLNLNQLRTAARLLNICDRTVLTKNKTTAQAKLFPLLEGLPAVVLA
jgi:hypothetical protein